MGYGHIYAKSDQQAVIEATHRYAQTLSFQPFAMTPDLHPKRMREITEDYMRLYWISPQLAEWTGIFEFRYYENYPRDRWGYTDGGLAVHLSKDLKTAVYQIEVVDSVGFWYYNLYENGEEKASKAYQEETYARSSNPGRYELWEIIKREGIENISLGYEHIPGPTVCPIALVPQKKEGIAGYDGFKHLAFKSTRA